MLGWHLLRDVFAVVLVVLVIHAEGDFAIIANAYVMVAVLIPI